ncbi:MAG: glutaredoxin 3 [Rouxiella aceris]|jgi:glutaredoxin 3|uniref:Glutaredoxin n=1 Tax=Rouxiella aceris TaxID=2703884 RepID=A0A848MLL0_9GAMM|nr:glutaredoxin 3 [Rouxiella aceris]MDR3432855.1 glutaredoxin 3 [Rouxiella aceris]NMP29448.1 glutaredoxin 3 [Rouxiella aceris]
MAKIEIFTKATCPYCHRAKALLNSKGAAFSEIAIDGDAQQREVMIARSGRTTVPQIFIDGQHIGGCDDLHALDARGGLDPLL